MSDEERLKSKDGGELLFLNYTLRDRMLESGIVMFSENQMGSMKRKTLQSLVSYYESVLEAIGGPEIWQILEALAFAENKLADRRNT
jgi:hypothetical protein